MEIGELVGGTLVFALLPGLAALALIVYALVDLFRRPMDTAYRILWAAAILFFPIVGSLAYLLIGRNMRGPVV